jgi:two-component system chemotaxis sensor kinase CheA
MGMEIVKRIVVGELGGELMMQTEFGKGTTFTLQVPLTISIVDAFVFESAGQRFAVPVAIVEEVIELESARGSRVPGAQPGRGPARMQESEEQVAPDLQLIVRRGQAVPVVQLAELLRITQATSAAPKAIVVRRAGSPIAFGVDRMLGQQEVVIRPMNDALTRAPGIAGATDLGDGRPTLVLDLVALGAGLNAQLSAPQVSR